ncbi:RagB/SusD family nutrient uptake outer membrane protein [Sunxiuqinia indica]|uniref:RagB/SusD family nutrient uptake outer membrane protein n=1 Tax=Sunxiuqinia indica TaxID=2692584 RepID=UPI001356912F|nr:RagB/SusD family nutrient uptake outer membrane protein [Sunxiuqinia indica]
MKKYKLIYLLVVAILGVTSCSEDFLTKLPETVVSAEDFYQTKSDYEQAIIGVYQPLRTLYNTGLAGYGAWTMGEMRSDNTTFSFNAVNRGYADREYVDLFIDDSNGGSISNKYNNDYIIIGRANQLLSRIDEAEFDEAAKNNYKGQALFLRAFAYFDLVQYFGDVPLIIDPPTSYNETLKNRTPKDLVYDQIIADASTAAELLPAPSAQPAGYVANGAAYTLLGNVYLVLEEWEKAEIALTKVTGYSLLSDYASIFNPNNKNNAEMIFEVQYTDDPTAGAASNWAYNFLPILNNPGVIAGFPDGNTNAYAGWNVPTPDLIASYEDGDQRLDASIGFYTGEGYTNRPYVKKYVHGASIAPNTNDDWPVYRYAEVLLMLAEAHNEQDEPGDALTYLNMVHAHSRTGLAPLTITDKAQLREAILRERQIELAFENKRWLDLVRTDNAIEVMNAQGAKIKANPQEYYYPAGISPISETYNVTEKRLIFPIPEREIRLNPDMEQNPGY